LSVITMQESILRYFRKTHGNFYGTCYRAAMLSSALFRMAVLAAAFPVAYTRRRRSPWSVSFRKWGAIIRWSLSQEAQTGK
jgi:hypothetical protein